MMKNLVYGLDSDDISCLLRKYGSKPDTTSLVMNLIYRSYHKDFNHFSQLSLNVREHILKNFDFNLPQIIKTQEAQDGTIKFLIKFQDGKSVESVCLPFYKKFTVCLSSQVGCGMNCSFCHTATQGLKRHLSAQEIVAQFLVVQRYVKNVVKSNKPVTNVVFMGQGEPLHNFENVKKAIKIFTEPFGIGLGVQNITLSTSGYLPGLKRFQELGGINLALSLHSTRKIVRDELIPINKRFPLEEVMQQIDSISLRPKQKVEYEYLLIRNLNDTTEDAELLANLLGARPALVNIIPFNEFPNKRPKPEEVESFKHKLVARGIRVMVRQTKGDDILAACGQLKS